MTYGLTPSDDPLSARIEQIIEERGKNIRVVAALAGLSEDKLYRRRRQGTWKPRELAAIADVLRMRVTTLIGDVA